jgi:methyl-accepting chemotaxis protein
MRLFLNLSTRAKLFAGFGLMLGFLAAVIAAAYVAIKTIETSQRNLDASFANVTDLATLESNVNSNRVAILAMLLILNPSDQQTWIQDISMRAKESDEALRRLVERNRSQPAYSGALVKYEMLRSASTQTREQTLALIRDGKLEDARKLALEIQNERYLSLRAIADDLGRQAGEDVRAAVARSEQTIEHTVFIFIAIGTVALLIGAGLALVLSRSIANPLKDVSRAAERIASGDITIEIPSDERRDEVGVLTKAFRRMIQSLQEMAGVAERIAEGNLRVAVKPQSDKDRLGNAFAVMIGNLRTVTRDIAEGANVLGASASQIVASSTQLAAGSAQTATALGETTTTVEEVRQTAQVATQKAKYVSESAQNVAAIAQTGRKSTEETGAGMNRIREQMDSIAQSMVRLSEQTQAIGQIITTVDDLAQQSNLLAVNASIEAAKAGEQGKGFTVVAQEVKSLAEQSKAATTQVRTILNDIQKATGAAVMATEQGSKAVEAGGRQSQQAGESIVALAGSVAEAAQAATQIAASSQQQLVGMDQVALAMESVKQASTQNVDSAKQLEEAARNLDGLGRRLRELVKKFEVKDG